MQGGYPASTPIATTRGARPTLGGRPAPADSDHDGMTDAYETANGLNPNNAADRQAVAANGYTNLENYLNGLGAVVTGTKSTGVIAKPLLLYPNPASQRLTVAYPYTREPATVEVYTFDGRKAATFAAAAGSAQTQIPLDALSSGNYLVLYSTATERRWAKLSKE